MKGTGRVLGVMQDFSIGGAAAVSVPDFSTGGATIPVDFSTGGAVMAPDFSIGGAHFAPDFSIGGLESKACNTPVRPDEACMYRHAPGDAEDGLMTDKDSCNDEGGDVDGGQKAESASQPIPSSSEIWPTKMYDAKKVEFNLYTRNNRSPFHAQKAVCGDRDAVAALGCGATKKTYFLVHGWLGGKYSPFSYWMHAVKQSLLDKEDCNVFLVNWGIGVSVANIIFSKAVKSCKKVVGPMLAYFIGQLEAEKGIRRANVHIIGHSLGGLVASWAGKRMKDTRIGRITGLDTPDFAAKNGAPPDMGLNPNDAYFVDAIHSLYSKAPKGHADFYPNGGSGNKVMQFWRHMYAPTYFTRSIKDGLKSYPCNTCNYESTSEKDKAGAGIDGEQDKALNPGEEPNSMGIHASMPKGGKRACYYLKATTRRGYKPKREIKKKNK